MSISSLSSNITKSSNAISLYQGESKDVELAIVMDEKQPDGTTIEKAVSLVGSSIQMTVRKSVSDPEILISKNSSNALEIDILTPEENGEAIIYLDSIDTQNMPPGEYIFDVWVMLSSGKKYPVVRVSEFEVESASSKSF